ncbi:MAG TPA: tRNA uridine-5-carboxymethylaminomethyl(34) synthesis enzyme MnmG [Myxococcota bacterium]|nr:tRNA uridine-5-carboxymethylaminomethyl(34) synthesis enzyme MnmG [Myxococcota bacterium]
MTVPRGTTKYDVVVIGAGHAGCEAALACSRLGLNCALVTLSRNKLAAMSCNPAIGGLGKSQIVREIDALGGEMGRAADDAAIQFRRLNASRGPAVRARRVQCDMGLYQSHMLAAVDGARNLELIEGMTEELLVERNGICGVVLAGDVVLRARAVVVTTGTFLKGLVHVGLDSYPSGRLDEPAAEALSGSLAGLGLVLGRLKTGTPARLDAASIDFSRLEEQVSDEVNLAFSNDAQTINLPQVCCHLTRTNERTHAIIKAALDRSPLFSGVIKGRGPRYCPSIEDKVVRFPEKVSHQVVLEPTDLSREIIYPNGISTSLPKDVQDEMIHSIEGLECARVRNYGYAIEYDFVEPKQLRHSLEVRKVPGLFLAGQINGTSGYEEAAGQGLVAGVNAAARISGKEPLLLGRHEAYIGVMIDDLVSKGVCEPYRMFSSRAEFRLLLREDNATGRLESWAEKIGLVPQAILESRRGKNRKLDELVKLLGNTLSEKDGKGRRPTLGKMLRRPGIGIASLVKQLNGDYPNDVLEQAEVQVKYQGYIERQTRDARHIAKLGRQKIPESIYYEKIDGLSAELKEKLIAMRPENLSQAARIDGMTPAAMMLLSIQIGKATANKDD